MTSATLLFAIVAVVALLGWAGAARRAAALNARLTELDRRDRIDLAELLPDLHRQFGGGTVIHRRDGTVERADPKVVPLFTVKDGVVTSHTPPKPRGAA